MSTRTKLLSSAAQALGDAAERTPTPPPTRDARAKAIAAMELALRARASQKRRRGWYVRLAVAASVLLGALGAQRLHASRVDASLGLASRAGLGEGPFATGRCLAGSASAFRAGRSVPFDGARLASGDRVVTPADAHAEIALSDGTSVVLAPTADVTFAREGRAHTFGLDHGAVRARVSKLRDGDRFLVRTKDAEVEVRGTVFEVSLVPPDPACGDDTPTRVRVTEGVVVVRSRGVEARVGAGEAWPRGCVPPAAAPSTPSTPIPPIGASAPRPTPSSSAALVVAAAPRPSATAPTSSAAAPRDGLAEKNDLFSSALAAKRRGDLRTALSGFGAYLTQYPGGELAENAAAQRLGLLSTLDPPRAAAAAREYLARWPKGFAREEARALAGGADPPAKP